MVKMEIYLSLFMFCSVFITPCKGQEPITISAQLNSEVTLPCVVNNNVDGTVSWYSEKITWLSYGEQIVNLKGQIKIEKPAPNEWNLRIHRVSAAFADVYTCQTGGGEVFTKLRLVIETPPKIEEETSSPMHVNCPEHQDLELKCGVTGIPDPTIEWYRGTTETPARVSGPKLIIRNIERYATDVYLCRANNKHGTAERRINVTVDFPPQVDVMESEVFAARGAVAFMSCLVQASPLFNAFWLDKHGNQVRDNWKYIIQEEPAGEGIPAKFINLIIKKAILSDHDYGTYTCRALGAQNEAEAHVALRPIEEKPKEVVINYN